MHCANPCWERVQFLKHWDRYINQRERNKTADSQIRWARCLNSECSKSPAQCIWFQLLSCCRGTRQLVGEAARYSLFCLFLKIFYNAFSQSWLGAICSLESAENLGRKAAIFVPVTGKNFASLMFSQLIPLHLFTQLTKTRKNMSKELEN